MSIKHLIGGLLSAALLAAPALGQAQHADEQGVYLGASLGRTTFKGFCSDARSEGFVGGTCDEKDGAWKFYGGYRFHRHFAVEASYINWGEASVNNTTFMGLPTSATGEVKSMGIAAVAFLPLGERFAFFGKLGFLSTEIDVRATVAGFTGSGGDDETEAHYGAGITYGFTRNLSLRGEWERAADTKADMLSIGLQYRF